MSEAMVSVPLSEFDELRNFKKSILEGKIYVETSRPVFEYRNGYGKFYRLETHKMFTKDEALEVVVNNNKTTNEALKDIETEFEEMEFLGGIDGFSKLKEEYKNHDKKYCELKNMSIIQFIKMKLKNK